MKAPRIFETSGTAHHRHSVNLKLDSCDFQVSTFKGLSICVSENSTLDLIMTQLRKVVFRIWHHAFNVSVIKLNRGLRSWSYRRLPQAVEHVQRRACVKAASVSANCIKSHLDLYAWRLAAAKDWWSHGRSRSCSADRLSWFGWCVVGVSVGTCTLLKWSLQHIAQMLDEWRKSLSLLL